MKNFRFRLQAVCIALLLGVVSISAQEIRYVDGANGKNANSGLSWAAAKADIQDAINDLVNNNLTGEVRVKAGTYKPTETTESSSIQYYKAFKIPAGITVRGGYAGTEGKNDKPSGDETILSGNLTGNEAAFTFNNGKYSTSFYGNSYHVVWFAMNGFENGRAKALAKAARLENCTVEGGHAYNTSITGRNHTAYGGGIYMVGNSYVTNCIVRNCDASRNGGGIFMDGGGEVRHTTVTKCQALGIGIDYGFGGGICAEGNDTPYYAIVTQSKIQNNVGRMGGGMALFAQAGANKYHVVSNSTLINNNTATTEAGGVYMENGGGLANMTIARNNCNGTGVNANGVEYGRAAGVFCHDCGNIGNSVIWGNTRLNGTVTAVQLVAERSANSDALKTKVRYCALSNIDDTDWSSTIKQGLKSLNSSNDGAISGNKGNALFNKPTATAGVLTAYSDVDNAKSSYAENEYCWNIDSHSAFRHAGIYTIDLDHEGETPAPEKSMDINDNVYNPRATLGAYSVQGYAVYPKITGSKAEFFIDPNFLFSSTPTAAQTGQSWDNPGRFLANAFEYIKEHKSLDLASMTEIIVYVKQGTINNTNSKATGRVRLSSIDIPAGVKVYGGYAADLTGTDVSKRNPIQYPSIITGEVTEGEYDYNVAHLVTINGNNVTLDGFKITLANAYSTKLTSASTDGAAITIKGATGVTLKNLIVSNCQADHGAAVYADKATVKFENCIFHNNTVRTLANSGLIHGINGSNLTFDHCNVLRSVGHASYLSADTKNKWTNSMFYGNLDRAQDNTNNCAQYAIIAFAGPGANNTNLTGDNNMFDTKTKGQFTIAGDITGADAYNVNGLNYTYQSGTANGYPRMINPTKNAGISPQGDITYYGRATSFEPHNDNPVVNAASYDGDHTAWGKDITDVVTRDFGGLPDIGAIESHIATIAEEGENANTDGMQPWGAVVYVREYADNNTTHANGTKRDGTSWENAINGNAQYPNNTPTGWTKTTDTESVFQGFRIKNGNYYLRFNNNVLSAVSEIGQATVFTISGIVDNGNKDGGYTGTITGNHTLSVGNSYIGLRRGNNSIQYSTGEGSYSTLNITASETQTTGYIFAGTAPTYSTARYLNLNGTTVRSNSASTVWTLEAVTSVISSTVTGWTRNENTTGTINGLQYAVNQAEKMIESTGYLYRSTAIAGYKNKTGTTYTLEYRDVKPETVLTQVWVGAGTYTEPKGYELRNHVKVYGAFPKTGTPGMDQRRPQLSSGIQNSTENAGMNYADYETIIQPSNTFNDNTIGNEVHTLNHSNECRPTVEVNNTGSAANVPQNHVTYEGVLWDGFTIRHGRIPTEGGRSGGAGVRMFENFTLTNCVVRDNIIHSGSTGGRGCGIYCEDGTINNCYIMNNKCGATSGKALFGGGIYAISGEIFNSVITGNDVSASSNTNGSGIFIEDAKFYNNTIVNNHGSSNCAAVGTYPASAARANLDVYNTIVIGGTNGTERCYRQEDANTPAHFYNCYLQTTVETDFTAKPQIFTNCTNVTDQISTLSLEAANYPFVVNYATAISTNNYRLKDGSLCINAGTEDVGEAVIPDFDMDYAQRVQDCTIDIGAYEYNGAYAIYPHMLDASGNKTTDMAFAVQLVFYVTPEGYGTASATDPENAACAAKLQKVIDAAGRYKYENPGKQVIVKVANSKALAAQGDYFQYYATRTTDPSSTDTRNWSIIIPRGVEVWGGYTDAPASNTWSNSNNGFYTGTYDHPTDARDILANPTYFASYFYNRNMKINAVSYHVVTFTDRVYDSEGKPYLKNDEIGKPSSFVTSTTLTDDDYKRMSTVVTGPNVQDVKVNGYKISSRGVLDGIFVTGGKADAVTNGGNVNVNGYGGAAIVNEYAHVRNCILTGNYANNGGALALKDMGIVSGCLIVENDAQNGGGIYVFENGTKLSDGTTVNTAQGSGPVMDWRMPHVFTSTIANNKATNQGAGVWFNNTDDPNVRINSSVIWKNETNNDPNIAGNIFPEKPLTNTVSTDEYYPLAYTAVEGQRASGANNRSVNSDNLKGTRFATKETDRTGANIATEVANLSFYGLTSYSILNNTGMPRRFYESMLNSMAVSPTDYAGVHRTESGEATRTYIEMGARAYGKIYPEKGLMLRLYVAQPEDVDMDAAQKMMALSESTDVKEKYYSQEGSSSAYPFQSLQEALDYIYKYRSATQQSTIEGKESKTLLELYQANKLPFEIVMSQGVYYPTRDLADKYGRSLANTFPVPEAVSIYGSFAAPVQNGNKFYGAGYQAKSSFDGEPAAPTALEPYFITKNIESVANETTTVGGVALNQLSKDKLLNERAQQDNNANGIIEPWEFTNQTILSGNSVNTNNAGVYHVVTAVADQNVVGVLPWISVKHDDADAANCDGLHDHEEGQTIHLNGLQISGGNAYLYDQESLDKYGSYIYYQGGGLQVDGNRYNDDYNKNTTSATTFDEKHRISYGVGYRDIPLSITKCRFINNRAGYGGAISSNGTLDIFSSSFEANLAIAHTDKGVSNDDHNGINVMYPGEGGAILATHQLSCFNTVFANNEARFDAGEKVTDQPQKHTTFRMPDENNLKPILRAAGGAIMMGTAGQHHIVNCDFVRNKAMAYPAVFTMNPTALPTESEQATITTPEYSQILNSVAWGNEIDATVASKYYSAKFMCNVGPKDRTNNFSAANLIAANLSTLESNYQEAVWFSAYENGVSFTAHNEKDARDLAYSPQGFAAKQITSKVGTYQNCNIEISSENETLEGPNFGNPSLKAGIDGFMASADWSPARINRLTDAGSGVLKLNAERTGFDMTSGENTGAYVVTHYIPQFPEYAENLPLGTERYMNRVSNGEDLYRIALDPSKKSDKAYIDMGVYEYRYATLKPSASEVDLLWVATRERGDADGSTWDNATSDLQRAIETLLESRNGHKKEIHIMEGEYSPTKTYTPDGGTTQYQAFFIDTKQLNGSVEHAPGWATDGDKSKYYAQALTIKGGYSNDLKYQYDPKEYPTIIRQQASTSGAKTDYLIYIADPTQRYDLSDYTDTDDGAKPSSESTAAENTMPIQIDGVTLINDQAPANTQGSAIYYPDVTDAITTPTAVNVDPTVTYYTDPEMQNPAAPGVVTDFFSTRTYYTDAERTTPSDGNKKTSYYNETGTQKNDPAKLVLTKTLVIGSGKSGDTTGSAVYIGKNGGPALIYNTVFHSNYGIPLEAYNTINVNNTFAKNGGLVQLNDQTGVIVKSQMFNSALWLNNSKGDQVHFGTVAPTITSSAATFAYNSYTGGNTTATDYTVAGGDVAKNNYNTGLVDDNTNILNGPNFVNPGTDADNTVEAFMLRNFDIKPSLRLFNRGMDVKITEGTGHYYKNVVENKYDFSLASTTDVDVLNRPRCVGLAIDLGAYEYQGNLKQYIYVDPNKTGDKTDKAGDDWTTPLGYGDIQNALDLAGLYHANNPEQNGYVFVKGNSSTNKGENTNETITIRDGVTTYGSILSSYTDWHDIKKEGGTTPKYSSVDDFIRDIRLNREGVASTHANQTIVTGIKTSDATAFDGKDGSTPAIIDGFVITDPNGPTTPVLDVTNTSPNATIVVRNVIVADNDMSNAPEGTNVAQISNGLIYEALFRDNNPKGEGAVLKVSNTDNTKGYAVNVTVEGKTVGADDSTPIDGENESGSQIYKSITNSIDGSQDGAYGKIQNPGIFGYYYNIGRIGDTNKSTNADLNYQLSETSKYIDMCEAVNPLTGVADNLAKFINYKTDRDILGNPRLLVGVTTLSKIDRGAFETWKIENDWHTGHDNSIAQQDGYKSTSANTYEDDIKYTFYPHAGSTVYLMKDKYIVLDAPGEGYDETTSNPGFLLVKEGANLYTNGRHTTVAYVAVERQVRKGGSIVALPYAVDYGKAASVAKVSADGTTGELILDPKVGRANKYSGNERMDWKYIFQTSDTKCWDQISNVAANQGVLFEPNGEWYASSDDDNAEALLRFTAQGTVINDYIYEEYGPTKDVTLTKYDDAESTNNGADYTDELDMSWNCFGIPYLVSNYKPYEMATTYDASDKYMMNIPHTLWLYYDGKVGPDGENVNGDGGYYSVKSWTADNADWHVTADADKSLWVGEGIFTQTSTLDDTESLVFYRPVAPTLGTSSPAKDVRYYFDGTGIEETEDIADVELVATEYYTTDGARISRPHRGAIVIVKQVYSNGNVKTSKKYVK